MISRFCYITQNTDIAVVVVAVVVVEVAAVVVAAAPVVVAAAVVVIVAVEVFDTDHSQGQQHHAGTVLHHTSASLFTQ